MQHETTSYAQGGPGYVAGSDTSEFAARSVEGSAATLRAKVHLHVQAKGTDGATCDEIERELGLRHQTASARMRELEIRKLLKKTENRRRTQSGRYAAVYVAATPGE